MSKQDCFICQKHRGEIALPVHTIYEDDLIAVCHLFMPEMEQVAQVDSIALHVTCSAHKMGLAQDFTAVAEACAKRVFVPEEDGCCGFAGDKGFSTPELNAGALSRLKQQLPEGCEEGFSNSRTCEIGLSRHSGIPYRSIAYLVDRCFAAPGAKVSEQRSVTPAGTA